MVLLLFKSRTDAVFEVSVRRDSGVSGLRKVVVDSLSGARILAAFGAHRR